MPWVVPWVVPQTVRQSPERVTAGETRCYPSAQTASEAAAG